MDLRRLWTAPFPMDPATTTSSVPDGSFEDVNFELQESSPGTLVTDGSGPDDPMPLSEESSGLDSSTPQVLGRRKPIPRKGHKKSRRGCYSCKRRKIKCSEAKPCCENCIKAGITCEYPKPPNSQLVLAGPAAPLSTSPTLFTLNDMRFFHHFLVKGYPHLPVGGDHTWTMEIPAIAHQYGYLLKAMLALGASHLHLSTQDDSRSQALTHRVEALTLLNKALSRPAASREEADARFATFMVLTFQSTCIPEGLFDFLTMLRGCHLNGDLTEESYFHAFTHGRHLDTINKFINDTDILKLDTKTLGEAVTSLARIEPLCNSEIERDFHKTLMDVAVNGYTSPKASYESFIQLYTFLGEMSHHDFQGFIDSTNIVSLLLLSHFLTAHLLLRHISIYELRVNHSKSDPSPFYQVMIDWMDKIDSSLPSEYAAYNSWPRSFVRQWVPIVTNPLTKNEPWGARAVQEFLTIGTGEAVEEHQNLIQSTPEG